MNRKRLVIGIGVFGAAIAMVTCVRHCRRMMSERGATGQNSLMECCGPARRARHTRDQQRPVSPALAA